MRDHVRARLDWLGPLGQRQTALMADDSVWVARLVAAARSGTQLELAGEGSANPAEADDWDPGRTIPAAAVRAALLTKGLDPDPRGLRIRGANIIGSLDLEHATLPCTLTITYSRFNEPVLMKGLTCRQLVLTSIHRLTLCVCLCLWIPSGIDVTRVCGHA